MLFGVLGIVLTWPLAWHLGDRLPAGNNDLFQNYWNFWWWKTALLERGSLPYSTDLLFSGVPTSLAFHTHSEANILWTFPALLAFGEVFALNLATLGGFALAGWGAYLLARELLEDSRAAVLAGIVFAYFPQHFEQSLEHLNLASYGAMPLFLLFLLRGCRRNRWRDWALAGAFFALNSLFSWHNGLMVLPGAVLLFARELAVTRQPRLAVLARAAAGGLLAAALLAPFAWPMLREMAAGATYFHKPVVAKPIDIAFSAIPAEHHPLWGGAVEGLYARWRSYTSAGFTAYLGLVPLALIISAAAALVATRRRGRAAPDATASPAAGRTRSSPPLFSPAVWTAFAAGYLLLALGAELRFLGTDRGLPLPFALLPEVPLLKTLRVANRFLVPGMLGVAVLAGAAARFWILRARRPSLAASILALVVIADFLWVPYPLRELPRPEWIDAIAQAPSGAVLNVPGGYRARGAEDMYLQTLHGRPIAGGYVSCTPPHVAGLLERHPVLRSLFEAEKSPTYQEAAVLPGLQALLADLPIAVVAVHLDRSREHLEALRARSTDAVKRHLHNPERGMPAAKLAEVRAAMRKLWGEPYHASDAVELFRRPGG